MAVKIEMLRCFVTVAKTGALAEAAVILGRTPSALSMTLKQFEELLGEPLFETDRKSKLTALGLFAFEQASRELKQFDATIQAIENFASSKQGTVRIAAVPSFTGTILPKAISQFFEEHPDVKIELRDMDSASVLNEVTKENADIGIASAAGHPNTLVKRHLLSDALGVVCRVDTQMAQTAGPVDWDEISQERLIANSLSGRINDPTSLALHDRAALTAHNNTSLVAMVRSGLGITILPETAIKMLGLDDIVFRPLADSSIRRSLQILRKNNRPNSPAAGKLEERIFQTVAALGHKVPQP